MKPFRLSCFFTVFLLLSNIPFGPALSKAGEQAERVILTQPVNRFTIQKDNQPFTDDFIFSDSLGKIQLEPGHYTLKSFDTPGNRASGKKILEFDITESIWQTPLGKTILITGALIILSLAVVCIILVMTRRKERKDSKTLLDRNEKVITDQGNLLHDLKTPVSLIYNPIKDILDRKSLPKQESDILENVLKQAQKIADSLLAVSPLSGHSETLTSSPEILAEDVEEESSKPLKPFSTANASILFVDDDTDLLDYILTDYKDLFSNIYTANNGYQALELARDKMPDVIICDIMMPEMNGFDLCRTIKSDLELSHIPVILLTSRSNLQNQETGYKMGADAFVAKPFDSKTMYKMISNLLKNRWDLKKQYADSAFTTLTKEQTYSLADEQFILKLNKLISENLSNTDLDSSFLAKNLDITRTALFNKMSNLLGTSTKRYIRKIRIEYAKNLLANSDKSIGEIAVVTGFSLSHYFSTTFKQETGMTPRQYKEKNKTRP